MGLRASFEKRKKEEEGRKTHCHYVRSFGIALFAFTHPHPPRPALCAAPRHHRPTPYPFCRVLCLVVFPTLGSFVTTAFSFVHFAYSRMTWWFHQRPFAWRMLLPAYHCWIVAAYTRGLRTITARASPLRLVATTVRLYPRCRLATTPPCHPRLACAPLPHFWFGLPGWFFACLHSASCGWFTAAPLPFCRTFPMPLAAYLLLPVPQAWRPSTAAGGYYSPFYHAATGWIGPLHFVYCRILGSVVA